MSLCLLGVVFLLGKSDTLKMTERLPLSLSVQYFTKQIITLNVSLALKETCYTHIRVSDFDYGLL